MAINITRDAEQFDLGAMLARSLSASNLHFTSWQIAAFYTALQTKGFVILGGKSGMGKTRLAQHFAMLLPQPDYEQNWLFVSVRPDWRDSQSLLGAFNPRTSAYDWTSFLRFLLRAAQSYRAGDGLAWLVILDEMNLAHVEYYFADLLSVLESGWDEDGWTREPLRLAYPDGAPGELPPHELRLPPNLYIVGTANEDETTYAFSPKVLDRAFMFELTEVDFGNYLTNPSEEVAEPEEGERQALLSNLTFRKTFTGHGYADKHFIKDYVSRHPEIRTRLQTLNGLLQPFDLHFGYRVFDEILGFMDAAEYNKLFDGLGGLEAAFDAAVLMKVFPKFYGARGRQIPLGMMLAWCVDPINPDMQAVSAALNRIEAGNVEEALGRFPYRFPITAARVRRMLLNSINS